MTCRRDFLRTSFSLAAMAGVIPQSAFALASPFQQAIPLIVDADTANEVDDLFAIVRALLEPGLDVRGITAAQWHTSPQAPHNSVSLSQQMNTEIVQLMGMEVPLKEGSNIPLVNLVRPQPSEASRFIIDQAMGMEGDEKLHITVLGPCTNVASAVLSEPAIIPRIVVHYIGFWHNPETNTWNKREFNTNNDPNAVDVLLNTTGLDFNVMTASTSQHLVFTKEEVDQHLKGKGGVADYLVNRWETFDRHWQKEDPEKTRWIMWDVAIIEALAHPELAKSEVVKTPHDNLLREIRAYTSIDVAAMKNNYWKALDAFLEK